MSEEIQIEVGDSKIFGRKKSASPSVDLDHPPLIVALHGGGFTSSYFDCGEYSLLDRASAAGCPCIAIDRPGYGLSTRIPEGDRAVPRNAKLLQTVISQIWRQRDFDASGVVLIGHSVGGGIVNYIASEITDWPLIGVAFSGVLATPPSNIPPFWNDFRRDEWIHTPSEYRLPIMLGPPSTYRQDAPALTNRISTTAWWGEVVDMFNLWPAELAEVCAKIRVPVHCRVGAFDPTWAKEPEDLDRFAKAFTRAPVVDVKLVGNAGHCIEFHVVGDVFQREEIAFAIDCATRLATEAT